MEDQKLLSNTKPLPSRDMTIVSEIKGGMSFTTAAKLFGLSKQRIFQIVKKQGLSIKKLKKRYPQNYLKIITITCRECGQTKEFPSTAQNKRRTFCCLDHYHKFMRRHFPRVEK